MSQAEETESIADTLRFIELGAPARIEPVGFGLSNRNYFVGTDRGAYVVRFLVGQRPETIANDVAIQRQLAQAGVEAPRYMRNGQGEYLYRGSNGVDAVVAERIDGAGPREISAALASDIGRHLALFHTSVRELPYRNEAGLMNPGVADVSADARSVIGQPLPRGIIHGDLHAGNVLVDRSNRARVIAILDFEEAGENLYLIDLALTLMAEGAPWDADSMDPDLLRAVKQGYESIRPLTEAEKSWLPVAIRYASEAWINWFEANGYERYARQHRRRYDRIRWMLESLRD